MKETISKASAWTLEKMNVWVLGAIPVVIVLLWLLASTYIQVVPSEANGGASLEQSNWSIVSPNIRFFSLGFEDYSHFWQIGESRELMLNTSAIVFLSLLAFSGLLFLMTQGRERRFYRFGLGVLFFALFISAVIAPVHWPAVFRHSGWWLLIAVFAWLLRILWLWIIYHAILATAHRVEPLFSANELAVSPRPKVSKWVRLFHLVIDLLVVYFVFSPLVKVWFVDAGTDIGQVGLTVVAVLARFVYYLFFELLLNATPAKLLSRSVVTSSQGKTPRASKLLGRTAARFVPFEVLSGFAVPWHDEWTDTQVVHEPGEGKSGRFYFICFLVIMAILILLLVVWMAFK